MIAQAEVRFRYHRHPFAPIRSGCLPWSFKLMAPFDDDGVESADDIGNWKVAKKD
jgi:hypothetical protein